MNNADRLGQGTALKQLLIGASLAGTLITSANAQVIELKATHFVPPNHTFHKELLRWGEELAQKSNGRLKLSVFPSAQMGPPPRQFDLVRTGVADIGIALTGLTPGRFPMTEISNLPFACTTSTVCSRLMTELAPRYLAKDTEGVKLLQTIITPPLKFHLAKAKIDKMADFKGLRIRYAGELFAQSVKAFGATPVAVPPGDVVDAMSKGTIDGALFPFEGAASFQLGSVAKFSTQPGTNSASFLWVMNPATYAKLPKDLQAVIDQTTGPASAERIGKILDDAETDGRNYMTSKGVQIIDLSDATRQEMNQAVAPLIEDYLKGLDAKGQSAHEMYKALLERSGR